MQSNYNRNRMLVTPSTFPSPHKVTDTKGIANAATLRSPLTKGFPLLAALLFFCAFLLLSCEDLENGDDSSNSNSSSPPVANIVPYPPALRAVLQPILGNVPETVAGIVYVSENGGSDASENSSDPARIGSSWAKAYAAENLKTAIDVAGAAASAANPYLVLVGPGIYEVDTTLNMKNHVTIAGGVAEDGSLGTPSSDNPNARVTTFDGDSQVPVFKNDGLDNSAILYGVIIEAGNSTSHGGGMLNNVSSPILIDIQFSNNKAGDAGGGMYNNASSPKLIQVKFLTNLALEQGDNDGGGGMYNGASSSPSLTKVEFSENSAPVGGGMANSASSPSLTDVLFSENRSLNGGGGGMYNIESSSPTLTEVEFSHNSVSFGGGGGMYNNASSPSLTQVIFNENTANNDGGGGMYNGASSSPSLTKVTFSENSAQEGGGMANNGSSPSLTKVVFSNNSITADASNHTSGGGGMYNVASSSSILTQVVFDKNKAEATGGGGMYNKGSSPILRQVTFSGNSVTRSDGEGGGMFNGSSSSPTLIQVTFFGNTTARSRDSGGGLANYGSSTITNSIFWGNTQSGSANQIYLFSGSLKIYNSIVQGTNDAARFVQESALTSTVTKLGITNTDPKLTNANIELYPAGTSPLYPAAMVNIPKIKMDSPAINKGLYIKKSGDIYYYSEDATTWYTDFTTTTTRPIITTFKTSSSGNPPADAIDLTATDIAGDARIGKPDIGAYEYR